MELDAAGIRSKGRARPDGTEHGNQQFSQGALYLLLQNRTYRGEATHRGKPTPFFDEAGERLTPTWSLKKGTRYRYYVSTSLAKGGQQHPYSTRRRIPAGNLETIVIERLQRLFSSRGELLDAIEGASIGLNGQGQLISVLASDRS